jgi:hypothetical protein
VLPDTPSFSDVGPASPFFTAIEWAAAEGIAVGSPDGRFHPGRGVSRQAMAAYLYRMAGAPYGPAPDPGFSDVGADHVFAEPIAWMADVGITGGFGDGGFHPTTDVSRGSMAAFIKRYQGA